MARGTTSLMDQLKGKNVIVFDGECVLCSGFFRFVLKTDRNRVFSFATAQSSFGEALYEHYDLKSGDYDTNLVILDGVLYERLFGFFEVMKLIGWPWRILNLFSVLPGRVLDWVYYRIARNRYSIFGRKDQCMVPGAEIRDRFID